jgi:hypothetical protein
MRKLVAVFIVCLLFAGTIQSVFGSGIDNKTNWSVGYARTMNRNAVYDSVDAAVYNPAGIGRFDSGLFIGANNQSIFINYSHESAAELYEAKNPTLFLPSAFVIYKRARLGFYGAFYVPAGGGRLKYDDSIVDLSEDLGLAPFDPSAELFGVYYAGTAGVVYALNDMLSVSLGGRFICAKQTTKFETDTVMSGFPVGPFSGFNGETLRLNGNTMRCPDTSLSFRESQRATSTKETCPHSSGSVPPTWSSPSFVLKHPLISISTRARTGTVRRTT